MTDMTTRSPDEYTYTHFASVLADQGPAAFPGEFKIYNADPRFWDHPSPARFGHVVLISGLMRITGTRNARSGAAVSWFFSGLSLLLVAWLSLRFFNRWVAILSVTFLSFSFVELAVSRRAWQDATIGFAGLLLVCLTCAIAASPKRRVLHIAFFATGAWSLLIKESGWVSLGICILWLTGVAIFQERSWQLVKVLLVGGLASVAVYFAILSALAGGPEPVVMAQIHLLRGAANSPYGVNYDGPWYQVAYLLWLIGPLTAIAALFGLLTAVGVRRDSVRAGLGIRDWRAAQLSALVLFLFIAITSLGVHLQCLRLISPSDGPYCILAAFGVWSVFSFAQSASPNFGRIVFPVLAIALIAEFTVEYRTFNEVVIKSGMEDLAAVGIRRVMGL
jgi:hypothetical protein